MSLCNGLRGGLLSPDSHPGPLAPRRPTTQWPHAPRSSLSGCQGSSGPHPTWVNPDLPRGALSHTPFLPLYLSAAAPGIWANPASSSIYPPAPWPPPGPCCATRHPSRFVLALLCPLPVLGPTQLLLCPSSSLATACLAWMLSLGGPRLPVLLAREPLRTRASGQRARCLLCL